ncbi:hypothetical protein CAPTEDRAFT_57489, partial [Capitella teleta]
CHGVFIQSEGNLISPSYPNRYPANKYCKQIIRAPPNSVIAIRFHKFDLGNEKLCKLDFLQV